MIALVIDGCDVIIHVTFVMSEVWINKDSVKRGSTVLQQQFSRTVGLGEKSAKVTVLSLNKFHELLKTHKIQFWMSCSTRSCAENKQRSTG